MFIRALEKSLVMDLNEKLKFPEHFYGFLAGKNTHQAVKRLQEYIRGKMSKTKDKRGDLVFIDFSKAYNQLKTS